MKKTHVYVLDAWNDTTQVAVVRVFTTRPAAVRALERLTATPKLDTGGGWARLTTQDPSGAS